MALLSDAGITFFFLPPHSPKRNAIDARFRGVKHDDLLERTDTSLDDLGEAIDRAFAPVNLDLATASSSDA